MIVLAVGDIDIAEAFKVLHMDKRWSANLAKMASYVYPVCGFGGYWLPKDTAALYK
jgi:UDPglucose 6-dehydrogenase